MLTRKDYRAIAEILADAREEMRSRDKNTAQAVGAVLIADIAEELSVYFARDNSRFDRLKFLKAAQVIDKEGQRI